MTGATDNTASSASKDSQKTLFPPDSRISGVSSNGAKHTCYCAMHLKREESDEPSWTGGIPMISNERRSARIHFSDREPTIFEFPCAGSAVILSFRDDESYDKEELIGTVTKAELSEMGLWPTYRDSFKTVTGLEYGFLVEGEFKNCFEGNPIMTIDRTKMTDQRTFKNCFNDFYDKHDPKSRSDSFRDDSSAGRESDRDDSRAGNEFDWDDSRAGSESVRKSKRFFKRANDAIARLLH
ncbi:hypothetical protein L202_08075 [Cryptococcus amylolentus CBS 6039]|uniref:Uncharacterized protein n=1 Tax=Cryptococcus amylolentus CBS 6039 TaxID=1295533 RepID=A0A1E3HCV1_9TREE|nr:hypothetical protein L202_08075 [Cryptococcus amylolentus CBS 6039]ODN73576.1 hypothetical protein L202_08075 [Cryptococcus amylolentus CBS 6039]